METSPSAPELFLIVHKVRGQPAFDIAHKLMIGAEEGWIIPTSGHRAYPYFHIELGEWLLDLVGDGSDNTSILDFVPTMPQDWPDHYPVLAAPKGTGLHSAADLSAALGLRKAPNITRRI